MTTTDARVEAVPGTAQQLSRTQILLATVHVLREDGYDATTIRRIASRLDCAVGSIYRYFRDKRDLLAAVTEQMLHPVAEALKDGEGFFASVQRYHTLATQHAETYRLMFWVAHQVFDRTEAEARLGASIVPASTPTVAGASVPGVVREIIDGWAALLGDAKRAERCWALIHGLSQLGVDHETLMAVIAEEDVAAVQAMPTGDSDLRERLTERETIEAVLEETAEVFAEGQPVQIIAESKVEVVIEQGAPTQVEAVVQEVSPQAAPEAKPMPEIVITMIEPPRPAKPAMAGRESDDVTLL